MYTEILVKEVIDRKLVNGIGRKSTSIDLGCYKKSGIGDLATLAHTHESFLQCLVLHFHIHAYTQNSSSYSSMLELSIRNAIIDQLIALMQESFPEFGLVKEDCIEMSWIQSILYFAEIPQSESLDVLLNRTVTAGFFKGKSDYVAEPIPEIALEGLWQWFYEDESGTLQLIFSPYGGIMDEISESETPFPHRAGNLYNIHYGVSWEEEDASTSQKHINFMRRLYKYMDPTFQNLPEQLT
ncbi:hypothetical protein QUC31_011702 [Theobroma cacao]